jgi:hypothetical protein
MPVVVVVNKVEVNRILRSPSGPVARDLVYRGIRVKALAQRNLGGGTGSGPKRVDTGLLRSTIFNESVMINGEPHQRIGSRLYYAMWVHNGTGIYGPRHMRITPKTANVLAWKSKVYGAKRGKYAGWVFAKSTKGMKPNPFLKKALPAAILSRAFF